MVCVMMSRMRLARHTSDTHQSDAERRPRLMIIIMKINTFFVFLSSCFSHLVVLGEKDDNNPEDRLLAAGLGQPRLGGNQQTWKSGYWQLSQASLGQPATSNPGSQAAGSWLG